MPSDTQETPISTKVVRLAAAMRPLEPGALARLRRMPTDGPGEADFWRLAQSCGFIDEVDGGGRWLHLVKILAILAPTGDPAGRPPLHDTRHPLGMALCDGGRKDWSGARPLVSESRLMRFLALPPVRRGDALERLARMLAANRDAGQGLNCVDIAWLLFSDSPTPAQRLARAYYRRLDSAAAEERKDVAS